MTLTLEKDGKLVLPKEIRERYGLTTETPIRVVETAEGVLLVLDSKSPLSGELKSELEDWQALSQTSWEMFPYEETGE